MRMTLLHQVLDSQAFFAQWDGDTLHTTKNRQMLVMITIPSVS